TDSNGCFAIANFNILYQCSCAATASASTLSNVICNGNSNGVVTVSTTGMTNPISYAWSNGANTQTVSGLSGGTYTVTATGFNNCAATATTNVSEPALLTATINVITNVSCNGGNDGSMTTSASGGG